jgi:DNA repair exonuclease SbcCD ATPase subunit
MPEPSNALNKNLNQDNILTPTPVPLDNSSKIDTKDLTKKESWREWICRQWNDNKWYWIGGVAVVVGTGGVYHYRRRLTNEVFRLSDKRRHSMEERQRLSSEIWTLKEQRQHLTNERQSLSDEKQRLTEKIDFLKEQRRRLRDEIQNANSFILKLF